jgi:flavin reductase (DIM6/NTAB) family NADH-FMN oxidoreductase RutF
MLALTGGNKTTARRLKLRVMNTMSELPPSQIFLEAFRRHGAGIAVITALKPDGSPTGFTATSLASLSAAPPLASFNMSQTASSYRAITKDQPLLIHILGAHNVDLAGIMAGEASERFAGDHWAPGPDGLPLLLGVPAWLHARVVDVMEVEFAAAVAVRILAGGLGDPADALVYQSRDYRRTAPLA